MNTGSHTRKKVIDVEAEHQLCGERTGVGVVVRWRHVTADVPPAPGTQSVNQAAPMLNVKVCFSGVALKEHWCEK